MNSSDAAAKLFLGVGETGKSIHAVTWEKTPLGAILSWDPHLKTAAGLCINSPYPSILWWGKDHIELYNDACSRLLQLPYPPPVQKGRDGHPGLWAITETELKAVWEQKKVIFSENKKLLTGSDKNGITHFFNSTYQPVFNAQGDVAGVFATLQETAELKSENDTEQRLRLAIEAAEVGTFDWDMQTLEFIYSERLARMFGFSEVNGLVHTHFGNVFHPEDAKARKQAHKDALQTGTLFYELRLLWPDRSVHWVRTNGKIIFSEDGKPRRMYGTALDITQEKAQSEQLEKKVAERTRQLLIQNDEIIHQKQLMDTIIDASVDYICAIGLDEKILLFNRKYEEQTNYKRDDATGKNVLEIFPHLEDVGRDVLESFREALKGNAVHMEKHHSAITDEYYENFFVPLRTYSGEIFGAMLVGHDITDRIYSEQELMKTNEELVKSNQRLEEFAYVASHDLQEPLRKIQTFAELVHKKFDNREESEKYFNKIVSSAQRMSSLIKDVLTYSRLSDTGILFKEIDLNQIVENVKLDFELLIAQKNAVVECDHLPVIKGIPLQMNQLFFNLMSNSLKFSKKEPQIRISSKIISDVAAEKNAALNPALKYVRMIFKDNGIGFDQQYADQIFTIFQRLNDRQSYSGTGIGLALCKKIVENHGGSISASSKPGQGATFTIYLPV
ncbi:MAG: hypothetical protein JWP12_3570 [Bacteroidetes bacterium]|nr:hypothetical protein [Bacteroidota bacterium]